VGLGSAVYLSNYVLGTGFSGDSGGKIISLTGSGIIDAANLVAGTGLQLRHSTDALRLDYNAPRAIMLPENSGTAAASSNKGQLIWKMPRNGMSGAAQLYASTINQLGQNSLEPILNSASRDATAITNGTTGSPYSLQVNTSYTVNQPSASASIVLEMPSDSGAELVTLNDEITVSVFGSNGQVVDVRQSITSQYIKVGSTLSTSGATHGIRLSDGASVTLKCYSPAGFGYWQVVESTGTVVHF
jgi:hypothetical protein